MPNNAKNKDSDANLDYLLGDDNDNPASCNIYAPLENEVRIYYLYNYIFLKKLKYS